MTIITHKTYTRPNTEVEWHTTADMITDSPNSIGLLEVEQEFKDKKYRSFEYPDDLTLIVNIIWFDKEDYEAYWSRPEVATYYQHIRDYYDSIGGTIGERVLEAV